MVKNVSMILSPWEFVWKPSPGLAGCKSYRLLLFRLFGNPSCMRRSDRVLRFCYNVILLQCMRDRCQGSSDGGKNNFTVASALASVFALKGLSPGLFQNIYNILTQSTGLCLWIAEVGNKKRRKLLLLEKTASNHFRHWQRICPISCKIR